MWSEGIISCPSTGSKYKYWVKHYEESSPFGIDGGKISKLTLRKFGETRDLCSYAVWKKTGVFNTTEGNVVDYDYIVAFIAKLSERYRCRLRPVRRRHIAYSWQLRR